MAAIDITADADDGTIAAWVAARLTEALAQASQIAICVPGGSTPFPIIERLAAMPLAFPGITVWPGDDRLVPEDHPASNVGRIRALLEPAGAKVVALCEGAVPPQFALVWLGMGGDGHIASLFPNSDPRADDPLPVRRLRPEPLPPEAPFERLTLTIPALLASDRMMFVLRGSDKRVTFDAAARGDSDTPVARLLAARRQPVTCFC